MIYVSTGGKKNLTFVEAVKELSLAGVVAFELSGGKYCGNVSSKLQALSEEFNIALHNYFPPPKKPFVLNLASFRDDIAISSVKHITQAIDLSSSIGAKYFAFHAGYLIDPPVEELGVKISKLKVNNRLKAMDCFIDRASKLAAYAETKGVKLLVENNVLSKENYKSFGENPLLMVDGDETNEIMHRSHHNLGLLIDVAHLKVSSNTLSFSAIDYLNNFFDSVFAYHFSDNLGLEDSNDEISDSSWFWPYINTGLDYYSLEVYNKDPEFLKNQIKLVNKKLSEYA